MDIVTRIEAALDSALANDQYGWYRAEISGDPRWIVHPLTPRFPHVENDWAHLDPMPEGYFYALEWLPPRKRLLLTHSTQKCGTIDWPEISLTNATVIELEWLDTGARWGRPDCELATIFRRVLARHPPNVFSRT